MLVLGVLLVAAAVWLQFGTDPPLPTPPGAPLVPDGAVSMPVGVELPPAERSPQPVSEVSDEAVAEDRPRKFVVTDFTFTDGSEPGAVFVVVDETGQPIRDATVQATAGERDLATERTDEQGVATLRRVPPNAGYRVRSPYTWPVSGSGCVAGTTTRVVLRKAPLLEGIVYDAAGNPIAGANVKLLPAVAGRMAPPPLHPPAGSFPTLADGRFFVAWPDTAAYDVIVEATGHAPAVVATVRAETQGSALLIVRLQRGASVAGVARAADGAPLLDARIEVWSVGDQAAAAVAALGPRPPARVGQLLAATRSMARGAFVLRDLPPTGVIVALGADHGGSSVHVTLAPGRATEVELTAAANCTLRGEVPGADLATVEVFLYGGPRFVRSMRTIVGGFVFFDVPPGRYLVGTAKPPLADHLHAVVQEFVVRGASSLATTIDLQPGDERRLVLAPPVAVVGTVTGTAIVAGAPAVDHVVALEPLTGGGAQRREATVGADGAFRIDGVPPGDYDARLRTRGDAKVVAEARCRVRAGDTMPITLSAP